MKDAPDDRDLPDVLSQGLSRRRFLLGTLLSPSVIPLLGVAGAPTQQLTATEESVETENNWEGPFYKPGAPLRSGLREPGMAGTPLTVTGRVLDTNGRPLNGRCSTSGRPITQAPTTTPVSGCEGGSTAATMAATRCARSSRFTTGRPMTCALHTSTSRQASRTRRS